MSTAGQRLLVLYVPGLDRRRLDPDCAPFLTQMLARHAPVELETHPSVELLPTIVTGSWPHEHKVWQVRLLPDRPRTPWQQLVDLLPDRWTTAIQCARHAVDSRFDLPTIPPRRRRRFEMHRIKTQRRRGGGLDAFDYGGRPTVFSALGGDCRHRTVFSFAHAPDGLAGLIDGGPRLDLLEFYALDLFSHWNLDRPAAMRDAVRTTDRLLRGAVEKARQLNLTVVLLVDHGQEPVRQTIDLPRILAKSGAPPGEFTCFIEVTNARLWYFTARARRALEQELAGRTGFALLDNDQMARHHVGFQAAEGFGDAYLICEPGTAFFPHDFYHPLVNAWMARRTPEQAARKQSPIHRGAHGYLPGGPADRGYLVALDDALQPVTDRGQLIDVAPTWLALLGADVPATMAGRPLLRRTEALRP